jgi:hypothetical protein
MTPSRPGSLGVVGRGSVQPICRCAVVYARCSSSCGLDRSRVPDDGTSCRAGGWRARPKLVLLLLRYVAVFGRALKSVPSTSMRCRTTASLRASATLAFFGPLRFAMACAQSFRAEPFTGRVRMTLAAS